MDANLKKIQITPMKFDKEGDPQREEFATIVLDVPMDSYRAACRDYRAV